MMQKFDESRWSSFKRTRIEFKDGFGLIKQYYWLGNDEIHNLTKDDGYKLRVELVAEDVGRTQEYTYWAEYSTFIVGDEASNYQLTISGYSGDAGDILDVTTMPYGCSIPYVYNNPIRLQ